MGEFVRRRITELLDQRVKQPPCRAERRKTRLQIGRIHPAHTASTGANSPGPTCIGTSSATRRASFGRIAPINRASTGIPSAPHTCRGRNAAPASAKIPVIRS